ncbi:MAG: hypothetical protein L0Y71_00110 [Gemmataceae bacterium]|nr:hypothetical protein [Gemmataceae bacterium]
MTRETKIGLVVAVSFLCLVGVVVATKWRGAGDAADLAQNAAPKENAAKPSQPNGANPPQGPLNAAAYVTEGNASIKPQANGDNPPPMVAPVNDPSTPALPPVPSLPMVNSPVALPVSVDDKIKAVLAQIEKDKQNKASLPPLPLPSEFQNPNAPAGNLFARVDDNKNKVVAVPNSQALPAANSTGDVFNKVNDAINKLPNDAAKTGQGASDKFDALLNKTNDAAKQGLDKVKNGVGADLVVPPPVAANPMLPEVPLPPPASAGNQNPFARIDGQVPPVPPPGSQGLVPAPGNPFAKVEGSPPAIPAPVNQNLPPVPNGNANNNSNPFAKVEGQPPQTPAPVSQNFPPVPNGNPNNIGSPFAKSTGAPPPIPAPANQGGLPPITNAANNSGFVIPAPKAGDVKVTEISFRQIDARPGQTFASISKEAYGSEAYANALLAYNRDFTNNRSLTTPQPGSKVLLPPAQVLQERYLNAVADARPRLISTGAVTVNQPTPVIPRSTIGAPPPTADVTKSYRVPGQGQAIYELAIQTLGDGTRWTEIYRLNPNIDPLQPIPGGSMVRLPGNARVP